MKRRKFIVASLGTIATVSTAITTLLWCQYPAAQLHKNEVVSSDVKQTFFSKTQYMLVAKLASHIVPSDEAPGADEANVAEYIDQHVAVSSKKQKSYSRGLLKLDDYSKSRFSDDFLSLNTNHQYQILEDIFELYYQQHTVSKGFIDRISHKIKRFWRNTHGDIQLTAFIGTVRRDVLEGFYSHPLGWKVVGYYGPPQPIGYTNFAKAPKKTDSP